MKVEGAPRANPRGVFTRRNVPKALIKLERLPPLFTRSIAIHRQPKTLGISLRLGHCYVTYHVPFAIATLSF